MATVSAPRKSPPPAALPITLEDVRAMLPGFPLSRIRLVPAPGTATEADVLRVRRKERILCELVDGVLVEKQSSFYESVIAAYISTAINVYLDDHPIGVAAGADAMLRILPRQVRLPDVTFVFWKQFPSRKIPKNPILRGHPDLAVEVLSKSNTKQEMKRKLKEYFNAGTQLVWIADPPTKTVTVYTSPTTFHVAKLKDSLDGGDVLPGFRLPVARIFRE